MVQFSSMPEAWYWKQYIDQYGLPEAGGWLDQPYLFMREIEFANRALMRYAAEEKRNDT